MSSTFTDFLRERAAERKAQVEKSKAVLADWREALERLYATIRGWLQRSDPDGVLTLTESEWELREEGLGRYSVPRLDIHDFDRQVTLVPKARYTVATAPLPGKTNRERATGRVDLTDEVRRTMLYRFSGDEGDVWLMDDQKGPLKPLDQASFEEALLSYLQ